MARFWTALFGGTKHDKDMKRLAPIVESVKKEYGWAESLSDEERADEALVPADDATENCEVCVQTEPEITEMMNELWKELKAD